MCARISLCCRPPLFLCVGCRPPSTHSVSKLHAHFSMDTHTHNDPYFLLGGRVLFITNATSTTIFSFFFLSGRCFFYLIFIYRQTREREIMGVVGTVTRSTHLDTTPIWSAAVVKTISAGVVPIISRQSHLINYTTVRLPITHLRSVPALIVDQF